MDYVESARIWPKVGIRRCLATRVAVKMAKGRRLCGRREEASLHLHLNPYLLDLIRFHFLLSRLPVSSNGGFRCRSPPFRQVKVAGGASGCSEGPLWRRLQEEAGRLKAQTVLERKRKRTIHSSGHRFDQSSSSTGSLLDPEPLRDPVGIQFVVCASRCSQRGRGGSQYAHIPQPHFQARRSSMRRLCPLAGIAAVVSCRNLPQLFLLLPRTIFSK